MEHNEFINICRLCAKEGDPILIEVFSKKCLEKTISIKSLIESSLNIKLVENEKLPNKICSNCLTYLEDFYSYRRKCRKNNDALITYLEDWSLQSEYTPNLKKYKDNVSSKKKKTSHQNSKINISTSNNSKLKSIILKINKEYKINTTHTENLPHLLNNKTEKDNSCMPVIENIRRTCETDCTNVKQDKLFGYLNLNSTPSNNAPNYDTEEETYFHLHLSDIESCQNYVENSFEKQLNESDSYVCIKDCDKKDISPSLFNIIKDSEIKIKKEVFNKNFNCSIQLKNCVPKQLKVNRNQRKRRNSVSSVSSISSFDEFQKCKKKRKRARIIYDDQFEDDMDDIVTETNNDDKILTEINHTDENFTADHANQNCLTKINPTDENFPDRANQNCLTEINHTHENITVQRNLNCLTEVNHTDEDFPDHVNQNSLTEINHTDENITVQSNLNCLTEVNPTDEDFPDHANQNSLTKINHTDENITVQSNLNCLTEVNHTDENFTDHANQNCLTKINLEYFRCSFCDRRYKEEETLFSHMEGSHFCNYLDKMQLNVSKLPIDVEKAKNATIIVDDICKYIILQNGKDITAVKIPEKISDRSSQSLELVTPRIESVFSLSDKQQSDLNESETIYISDHEENTSKTDVETSLLAMMNDYILEALLNEESTCSSLNNKQNSSEMFQNENESSEKSEDDSVENINKQKSKPKTSKLSSPWDNDLRTLLSGTDFCQKYSKDFRLIKSKPLTQTLATTKQDSNVETPEQTTNVRKEINILDKSKYESLQNQQLQKSINEIPNTGSVLEHQISNRIAPLVTSTHSTTQLPGIISATNKQIDTEQEVIIIDEPQGNNEFSPLQLLLQNQQSKPVNTTILENKLLNQNSQLNVQSPVVTSNDNIHATDINITVPNFHTSYENFVFSEQEKKQSTVVTSNDNIHTTDINLTVPTFHKSYENFVSSVQEKKQTENHSNQLNSELSIQQQQSRTNKIMDTLKKLPDEKISSMHKKVKALVEYHEKHKKAMDVTNQQNNEDVYNQLYTLKLNALNTCLKYVGAKRQTAETMKRQNAVMLNRRNAEVEEKLRAQNATTIKTQNGNILKIVFAKTVPIQIIKSNFPSKKVLPKVLYNQVLTPQNTTEIFNRTINSQNQIQQNLNNSQETIKYLFPVPNIILQQNITNNEQLLQRNISYVQNTVMPTVQVELHHFQNPSEIPNHIKLHKKNVLEPKQPTFSNISENNEQISESRNAQNQHAKYISNVNSNKPSSNVVAHIDLCDDSFGDLPSYYKHMSLKNYYQSQQNILNNSIRTLDADSNVQRSQENVHVPVNNNVVCVISNSVNAQTSQQNVFVPVENNTGASVNFSNENRSTDNFLRILSPQAINKRLTNNF